MTCWDNPELCRGCNYCQTARTAGLGEEPSYPLDPVEAHRRDTEDWLTQAGAIEVNGSWEKAS